jgi:hypothetical protein
MPPRESKSSRASRKDTNSFLASSTSLLVSSPAIFNRAPRRAERTAGSNCCSRKCSARRASGTTERLLSCLLPDASHTCFKLFLSLWPTRRNPAKGEKVDGGGELLQPSNGHLSAQDRRILHFHFRFIKLEIKTSAGCQRDLARVLRRIFARRERPD